MKTALLGYLVFKLCLILAGNTTTDEILVKKNETPKTKHENASILMLEYVSKDQKRIELKRYDEAVKVSRW